MLVDRMPISCILMYEDIHCFESPKSNPDSWNSVDEYITICGTLFRSDSERYNLAVRILRQSPSHDGAHILFKKIYRGSDP